METEKQEDELFDSEPFATDEPTGEPEVKEPEVKEPEAKEPAEKPEPKAAEAPKPEGTVDTKVDKPEPGYVPFGAVLDERDKRKALEQELAQFRSQQEPKDAPKPPDMFEDPEGWQSYQQQQFQSQLYAQRLDMSRRFAEQQHGKESVDAAVQWGIERCASDPYFNQMVSSQSDPVGFVVQQHQRDRIAQEVDLSELEQFKAWKAAQAEAASQQQTSPQQDKPPKSIASAPSAGGVQQIALGQEAVFDEEFQ